MKKFFWILIVAAAFGACQPEKDLYLNKAERDAFESMLNPMISNVAFIKNHDVYLLLDTLKGSIRLTEDSVGFKFFPRISYDGTKIAYINDSLFPVVINALTGDTIKSFPEFTGVRSYDWIKGPAGPNDINLYMLIDDTIKFTGATLPVPNVPINADTYILQAAFDPEGNYFYLATEVRPNGDITRLYRWEKSTGLIKEMVIDEPIIRPLSSRLSVSPEGDVLLALSQDPILGAYNTFYAFDKGSLRYSIKEKSVFFNTVRYNSRLKQALVYGVRPSDSLSGFIRLNYLPFPRAVDKSIDTTKYGSFIVDFDWK